MLFQSPNILRIAYSRAHHGAQSATGPINSVPLEAGQLLRFYTTTFVRHVNRSRWQPERPHNPPPFHTHPKLDTESLRDTLEAHRDANRAYLIKKIESSPQNTSKPRGNVTNFDASSTHETISRPQPDAAHSHGIKVLRFRSLKEYEGASQPLVGKWAKEAGLLWSSKHPWLGSISKAQESARPAAAVDALGKEIMNFEAYIKPDAEESAASEIALGEFQNTIKAFKSGLTASLIGSRANGLARPFSDIDVNLSLPATSETNPLSFKSPWNKKTKKKAANLIREVHRTLRPAKLERHLCFNPKELILSSRVPVAWGYHVGSGLKYQFQCTTSCQESLAYAKLYQTELPTLRPLFLVIQQMLQMRDLTNASEGGVGSYTLLMMVVVSLKLRKGPYRDSDIGAQLIHFLDFFATLDFYNTGIIVQPPMLIEKEASMHSKSSQKKSAAEFDEPSVEILAARQLLKGKSFQEKPFLMLLQDPAHALNNLGSNTWKIKHIQATIRDLKAKLEVLMNVWSAFKSSATGKSPAVKAQLPNLSLLAPLVGGNYIEFEKMRSRLRSFGRSKRTSQPSDSVKTALPSLEEKGDITSKVESETPHTVDVPGDNQATLAHEADEVLQAHSENDGLINGLESKPKSPEREASSSAGRLYGSSSHRRQRTQSLQGELSSKSPVRTVQPLLSYNKAYHNRPKRSKSVQSSGSSEPPSPADAGPSHPEGPQPHPASGQPARTIHKYAWSDLVRRQGGPISRGKPPQKRPRTFRKPSLNTRRKTPTNDAQPPSPPPDAPPPSTAPSTPTRRTRHLFRKQAPNPLRKTGRNRLRLRSHLVAPAGLIRTQMVSPVSKVRSNSMDTASEKQAPRQKRNPRIRAPATVARKRLFRTYPANPERLVRRTSTNPAFRVHKTPVTDSSQNGER
ncbi:MAG: hypothetical protein Q9160_000257 [Pyrenula sp. 1 TL-2023]